MTTEQLEVLYNLLGEIRLGDIVAVLDRSSVTPEEVFEATEALAEAVGNEPLFTLEELEG